MVLESLMDPFKAEKRPWELIVVGFFFSIISIALALIIFPTQADIISVFLIVISLVPLMYNTFKIEERKDVMMDCEKDILKSHSKAIEFFFFLFLGIVLAYLAYYLFLPSSLVENLFASQIDTLNEINAGSKIVFSGNFYSSPSSFIRIFLNNFKVLLFCVVFSFFYGAGAIFILTWNASVIAAAMGALIKNSLATFTTLSPLIYVHIFSKSFMRYFFHGIMEIIAYFVGALAGGIISVAVIRKDYKVKSFEKILIDVADLIILAIGLLLIAGLVEVYISPVLFG